MASTVRYRDSMQQTRMKIPELVSLFAKEIMKMNSAEL